MPYTGKSNLATVSEHDARARREANARYAGEDGGRETAGETAQDGSAVSLFLMGCIFVRRRREKKKLTCSHAHTHTPTWHSLP